MLRVPRTYPRSAFWPVFLPAHSCTLPCETPPHPPAPSQPSPLLVGPTSPRRSELSSGTGSSFKLPWMVVTLFGPPADSFAVGGRKMSLLALTCLIQCSERSPRGRHHVWGTVICFSFLPPHCLLPPSSLADHRQSAQPHQREGVAFRC